MQLLFSMILAVPRQLNLGISLWQPVTKAISLMDPQQCQRTNSPSQSYLRERVPQTTPPELWSSSSSSQPRTKGPGSSHMNLWPWVHGCDRQQWQCHCTTIKPPKGQQASFLCCPTSEVLPTSFQRELLQHPAPCEFYKVLSCKHFCHMQSRSSDRPSCAFTWDKPKSEQTSSGASDRAFTRQRCSFTEVKRRTNRLIPTVTQTSISSRSSWEDAEKAVNTWCAWMYIYI